MYTAARNLTQKKKEFSNYIFEEMFINNIQIYKSYNSWRLVVFNFFLCVFLKKILYSTVTVGFLFD